MTETIKLCPDANKVMLCYAISLVIMLVICSKYQTLFSQKKKLYIIMLSINVVTVLNQGLGVHINCVCVCVCLCVWGWVGVYCFLIHLSIHASFCYVLVSEQGYLISNVY